MPDDIEGESRELTVQQPVRLAAALQPEDTIALATRMATALKDIVEKQRLFAVINGRKYPQVEAWMTIARMDNVVAREVPDGIVALEDGSYEATVELIRLSDGMIVGRGSALCGTDGDEPWHSKRPAPAKRSMAVTRATSRAFRQQYSWIMALAGYEPTPAEEMPREDAPTPRNVTPVAVMDDGSLIGIIEKGDKQTSDFELRYDPDGSGHVGFRLRGDKGGILIEASGDLAEDLMVSREDLIGTRVSCWGTVGDRSFTPKSGRTVTYQALALSRLTGPEGLALPVVREPESVALFDESELDKAAMAGLP